MIFCDPWYISMHRLYSCRSIHVKQLDVLYFIREDYFNEFKRILRYAFGGDHHPGRLGIKAQGEQGASRANGSTRLP